MKPFLASTAALSFVLASCQAESDVALTEMAAERMLASADIVDSAGTALGTVALIAIDDRLEIAVDLKGVEPGTKAFHLHTTGECDGPDFTSAGGHLNPAGNTHGKLSEDGQHLGDLPNLDVADDGRVESRIAIDAGAEEAIAAMNDQDGTAIMLHAGPDDYISDPAGDAGPRIACGILQFT